MKIGIDARTIYRPHMKGIGVYLKNLLESLGRLNGAHQYVLFYDGRQEIKNRVPQNNSFVERNITISKGDNLFLWEQLRLPLELRRSPVDLFHSPANTTFWIKNCPLVVTIHDTKPFGAANLVGLAQGEVLSLSKYKPFDMKNDSFIRDIYNRNIQPFILRQADRIICPSHYSRKCIVENLHIPESKIEVIYQGLNPCFRVRNKSEAAERVKDKFGIQKDFILFTGGESPSKNISNLIKAFNLLKAERNIEHQLVLAGIRSPAVCEKHQKEIEYFRLDGEVIILGYLQEEDLIDLYNAALVFVYPSLFEGFGFPPLEAMACGTPVAASNATSIPEVVGEAALLFDGRNIRGMADQIYRLLYDSSLREDLRRKGFERIKRFQWQKTARETLKVYEDLMR